MEAQDAVSDKEGQKWAGRRPRVRTHGDSVQHVVWPAAVVRSAQARASTRVLGNTFTWHNTPVCHRVRDRDNGY